MTSLRLVTVSLALAGLLGLTTSCGGEAPPPASQKRAEAAPSWADVFDGTPELYVVLRPRAFKRDTLYGSFFKALMRAAQARGVARGESMVRAIEGAEEVIVGISKGANGALVLRGVPADVDPEKIVDASGKPLFGPPKEGAKVPELDLVDREHAGLGALFVLPDRTWTFAIGETRTRARTVFAKPTHRPKPETDPEALAVVRASGGMASLLLRDARFGVLAKSLSTITITLKPGNAGVVVALAYDEAGATAWAEMHAKRLVEELSKEPRTAWLKDAKVAYEGNTVFVRVALPPRLLEELPSATGADLGL